MYFEKESLQNNISDDLDKRNRNFEKIESDTTMMGTNLISNGDFSNGTIGWTGQYAASVTASGNEAVVVASAITSESRIITTGSVPPGSKYYARAKVKVNDATVCQAVRIQMDSTAVSIDNPVANVYYNISGIFAPSNPSPIRILRRVTPSVPNQILYVKEVLAINLTATFGAGNEPTVEQMDEIMSKFENSWFDGTKNLFRANETLKKQIAIDARTEFEAKNVVTNGDFSNGTTGWTIPSGATVTADTTYSATKLKVVSASTYVGIIQNKPFIDGNLIYASFIGCGDVSTQITVGNTALGLFDMTATPKRHSIIKAWEAVASDRIGLYNAGIGTNYYGYFVVIDLTTTFGAGKEPTLAEMDRLMARYPNSWFDGTKPIQTIETLYQEKANKVQEAWITPTLLNGWVGSPGNEPKYYKDEFGIVRLKGTMSDGTMVASAFKLIATYRPLPRQDFLTGNYYTNNIINVFDNGDVRPHTGGNTLVNLAGVTFKAEV